jgi:hypothetical protein
MQQAVPSEIGGADCGCEEGLRKEGKHQSTEDRGGIARRSVRGQDFKIAGERFSLGQRGSRNKKGSGHSDRAVSCREIGLVENFGYCTTT